jgi:hypothetical protein
MGTARNFSVKTGLDIDDGDLTLVSGNILVNAGYVDIDSIKIDGQTISTVTGNEAINLTPHGTGSVVISKVDINGGTVDATDITVGSGKTLNVSGGTLTLAADQISGDAITGGTIGATTITALTTAGITASAHIDIGAYNFRASTLIADVADGTAPLTITSTTKVANLNVEHLDGSDWAAAPATTFGTNGSGVDVIFHSSTAGDNMTWDASAEQLVITGTNGTTALNVADGNVTVDDTLTATNIGAFAAQGAINFNSQNMTNVDIDSGTIDGATIATSNVTVGSGKTLNVSAGTLTLAADQISGDAVSGGTIGTTTITALAGDLSLGDNNITNVGQISLDAIGPDADDMDIKLSNNQAAALDILQGSDSYMKFVTTTNSESIILSPEPNSNGVCKVVIGDNAAEDTMLVFDGAEIEYRLGIDDSANQFEIGVGEAHDTTAAIIMDNAGNIVQLGQQTPSNGHVLSYDGSKWTAAASASGADGMGTGFTVSATTDTTATTIIQGEDLMFAALGGLTAETTADGTVTHGLDVNGLTAAVIASGDFLAFSDEGTSGDPTKKESIDDIATLFAGTGLTAASAVISVDAAQTAATSSMTSSTSRTITTPLLSVESGTSSKPVIQIKNTHDGTTGAELKFVSNDASAGADGDDIGTISFYADDSGGNQTAFASILAEVSESLNTDEAGKLSFFIAESDGTNTAQTAALILEGEHATDGQVDVTIGAGAASTTTIVGDLVVNGSTTTISTAQLTVEDDLITVSKGNDSIANANGSGLEIDATGGTNIAWKYNHATTGWQSNVDIDTSGTGNTYKINGIEVLGATTLGEAVVNSTLTKVGVIATGTWQGTVVAATYLPDASATAQGVVELATIAETNTGTDAARVVTPDGLADWTGGNSAITKLGTIATGVWNGTVVASAYLDADTAHLSGAQTFTGTKTLNSFKGTGGATVTNILDEDAMGSNSATALATQQSIKAYADTKSVIAGSTSIVTTGALDAGSITSNFGTIDTGSSTITTTGLISGGSLDIDDVVINGTTIGHTNDTDLMTVASGLLTVAGEISVTTLDIGGTNVTSTAAELNLVDGITAGTVSASLAVIADGNKDVTGFRNVTGTGALQGATLSVDAVAILDTARGAAATITGETNLFSIPKATYKAAKLIYHIKKDDNNRTDAGEILVTHDGTNAFLTHYGQVNTDTAAVVGTWDCTVNSANIEVRFTPTANGAHTYGITATQMVV